MRLERRICGRISCDSVTWCHKEPNVIPESPPGKAQRGLFRRHNAFMWRFFLIPESLYVETLSDPKKSILDQD